MLRLRIDDRYSQHVVLARGEAPADYRVLLGALEAGTHRLTIDGDDGLSAPGAGAVTIARIEVRPILPDEPEHTALAHAPILHPRPGALERFSDLPLFAWVERAATPSGGVALRYSVVFSHEDGGTPTDRLMATWGRATDIEFVYGVELDRDGRLVRAEYQGPEHAVLAFAGTRRGAHPELWVVTDNNMVGDRPAAPGSSGPARPGDGAAAVRFALAPQPLALENASREVVMDANPWMYRLMAAELAREGRLQPDAPPGSGRIPDPRTFAYLEACGELHEATLAFDVGIERSRRDGSGDRKTRGEPQFNARERATRLEWVPTDRGDARFRIARSGCFRAAAPLPPGTDAVQVRGLRARAFTRPPREGEAPLPPGSGRVTLTRVNTVFVLSRDYVPSPPLLAWRGIVALAGEAPPVELSVAPPDARPPARR
ncbi:MAG TPA: hypothetical protein VNI83_02720 [Vicinamibacterales bacterium]|nr:hypothetical protein [Vicinamibacterales bacterium]